LKLVQSTLIKPKTLLLAKIHKKKKLPSSTDKDKHKS
jgi:hypothetical protein